MDAIVLMLHMLIHSQASCFKECTNVISYQQTPKEVKRSLSKRLTKQGLIQSGHAMLAITIDYPLLTYVYIY